jgi:hypothetical protein
MIELLECRLEQLDTLSDGLDRLVDFGCRSGKVVEG